VLIENRYEADAGRRWSNARDRILQILKSARALEILVNSPGRVGDDPCSVRFSSSTSAGYSALMSDSRSKVGQPEEAEINLGNCQLWQPR
jgi:hypothetical protein